MSFSRIRCDVNLKHVGGGRPLLSISSTAFAVVMLLSIAAPVVPSASAAATAPARNAGQILFTRAQEDMAEFAGIPDAHFWADSPRSYAPALPSRPGPWLVLTEGGEDGAYGAGVLTGWNETGKRPEFSVVTGVSAGALIAPYAFLGPQYDKQLREFTTITDADVYEVRTNREALFDTWPLRDLIAKRVTPQLLRAIAAQYRRGRRLFVVTTDLDAGRPVLWNMGAIAAKGDPAALKLFRKVLLASASIPGLFPPVFIKADADGRRIEEMHVDGGVTMPFFAGPVGLPQESDSYPPAASRIYVLVNGKLATGFSLTEPDTVSILGRSIAVALQHVVRIDLDALSRNAMHDKVPLEIADVAASFHHPAHGVFNPGYMRALFKLGLEQGRNGTAFHPFSPGTGAAVASRPAGQRLARTRDGH